MKVLIVSFYLWTVHNVFNPKPAIEDDDDDNNNNNPFLSL